MPPEDICEDCPIWELKATIDLFLAQFNEMRLMGDVAIRNPPSKHQEKLRQLVDLVRGFEHNIRKNEGGKD